MDLQTVALVIIAMASMAFLVVLGLVAYVVIRYRPSVVGILGLLGGAAWVGSPVDPIPEVLFGPLGLADDVAVMLAMALYVARLAARHRTQRGQAPLRSQPRSRTTVANPAGPPASSASNDAPPYRFGTPQRFGTSTVQDDD